MSILSGLLYISRKQKTIPMHIDFHDNCMEINGRQFSFPLSVENLIPVLGELVTEKHSTNEHALVYIFHKAGLVFQTCDLQCTYLKNRNAYVDEAHHIIGCNLYYGWKVYPAMIEKTLPDKVCTARLTFNGKPADFPFNDTFTQVGSFKARYCHYRPEGILDINGIPKGTITIEYNPIQPKSNRDYEMKPCNEECITFDSFNFKLAILQVLIYDLELLEPLFNIYDFSAHYANENIYLESSTPIPQAVAYFQKLPVPKHLAQHVTKINMDITNEIYRNIAPQWDGRDSTFQITNLTETEITQFPNLKKAVIMGENIDSVVQCLKNAGIEVGHSPKNSMFPMLNRKWRSQQYNDLFEYIEVDEDALKIIHSLNIDQVKHKEDYRGNKITKWCINLNRQIAFIETNYAPSWVLRCDDDKSYYQYLFFLHDGYGVADIHNLELDPDNIVDARIQYMQMEKEPDLFDEDIVILLREAMRAEDRGRHVNYEIKSKMQEANALKNTYTALLHGHFSPELSEIIQSVHEIKDIEPKFRKICHTHFVEHNMRKEKLNGFYLYDDNDSFFIFDIILWMYLHKSTSYTALIRNWDKISSSDMSYKHLETVFCICSAKEFFSEKYMQTRQSQGYIHIENDSIAFLEEYSKSIFDKLNQPISELGNGSIYEKE